jgi:hypothetical protein
LEATATGLTITAFGPRELGADPTQQR